MTIEDDLKHKYDHYRALQVAVGSCNALNFAMEKFVQVGLYLGLEI
jgi:hypothetical protein